MSIESRRQDKVIGGITYSVVPLGAAAGLKALDRFKNVIAPLLSSALVASKGLEEAAAQAMKSIPSALSYEDVQYFQKVFGDTSIYKDGDRRVPLTEDIQDLHFAGKYMELFDWLTFCMEVNFSGFFGELKKRAGVAMSSIKANPMVASTLMKTNGLSAES